MNYKLFCQKFTQQCQACVSYDKKQCVCMIRAENIDAIALTQYKFKARVSNNPRFAPCHYLISKSE